MGAELVTAVALYGPKSGALRSLLETVQAITGAKLRGGFRPYPLDQIHATVIRLDGMSDAQTGLVANQRYLALTGTSRAMDFTRAAEILATCLTPGLRIRIGGFRPGAPVPFSSRGQHPYERTFSLQGEAFVLMGWPVATVTHGLARRPLDDLRRKLNDANIMHWYHESAADIDNDFHLVVGHRTGSAAQEAAGAVRSVRAYLAGHPAEVVVGAEQLAVIAADSPTLAPARFIGGLPVDPAEIVSLYR